MRKGTDTKMQTSTGTGTGTRSATTKTEEFSTPPDADADPTEAIDAGAEDEEGNEDTAPVAPPFHHKRRKVTFA